jgi:hypothetical protein
VAPADSIQRTIATVTKEDHDRFHDAIVKLVAQFHNTGTRGGVIYWLKHEEIEREIFRLRLPIFLQWQRDLTVRFAAVLRLVNPDPSLHRRDWAQSPKDFSTRNLRCNGDPNVRNLWPAVTWSPVASGELTTFACLERDLPAPPSP